MHNRDDLAQYEKLWNDYACCLELLQQQLHYALQLQQYFPIYSGERFKHSHVTCFIVLDIRAEALEVHCYLCLYISMIN